MQTLQISGDDRSDATCKDCVLNAKTILKRKSEQEQRDANQMYSTMILSVQSLRSRLTRSVRLAITDKQKARAQESLVGKKNCLKYHNRWSEAGRRKGYFIGRSWLRSGEDGGRRKQGQGVYHFHLEIKCDFFSSSLNNLYRHRQFKKIVSIIYVFCSCARHHRLNLGDSFYFLSGITNSTSDQTHVII